MILEKNPNIYIHDKNFVYPKIDNQHIVIKKKKYDFVYDEKFQYRLTGKGIQFKRFFIHIFMYLIVFPVVRIRYALKIKGRENIKKYFELSKGKGMISICNHTAEWDYLFTLITRHKFSEFPMWKEGAESNLGDMMRAVGGIVIPKGTFQGMALSYNALQDVVREEKWLHIFPEAACWPFYPAVRNFELGAFKLAYDFKKPILPMGVKYRKPKGLYKLFKKEPCATLTIGEPVVCNYNLTRDEAIADMQKRTMESVMHLIGIKDADENQRIREEIYKLNQ